jgi:hypothetical protein
VACGRASGYGPNPEAKLRGELPDLEHA